jgi:ADP-ribose pyrophosphatase
MTNLYERRLGGRDIYQGRIINVVVDEVELPDGRQSKREVVRHPGAVGILAIDDDDRIVMLRQYRYAAGEVLLEIPAGKLEPGEDPEVCGPRELAEEAGLAAEQWTLLTTYYSSPGFSDELIHLYLAEGLSESTPETGDDDEFIELERVPIREALEMVNDGRIHNGIAVIGVLEAARLRGVQTDA